MDRVELFSGKSYSGLIESEDKVWLNLIQIERPPGKDMHLVVRLIDRDQVRNVVRLESDEQRAGLRRQIKQFRDRTAVEIGRMEAVRLKPAEGEGNHYWRYEGRWFSLDSTADKPPHGRVVQNAEAPTTRRLVVRAEQIFAAYRQILPPRVADPRPPRLVVFDSTDEYRTFLAQRKLSGIKSPACFLENENVVALGSDLTSLETRWDGIRSEIERQRADLLAAKAALPGRKAQRAAPMKAQGASEAQVKMALTAMQAAFDQEFNKKWKELETSERTNRAKFQKRVSQIFGWLYHESFHAYLENYVYPHQKHDVPYWLNEGLATMYEAGVLEGNWLRVDAPNSEELRKFKEDVRSGRGLPLGKLLAAGPDEFIPRNNAPAPVADRYYAHAWALAYYLTFEKHLLGGPALDKYVDRSGTDQAVRRLEALVGMPMKQFEREWQQGVLELRATHGPRAPSTARLRTR
jgi:hypothetical protein